MKIDFGETYSEQIQRLSQWHKHFTWSPRKISDHEYRWLEYVQRRAISCDDWLIGTRIIAWEYKTL